MWKEAAVAYFKVISSYSPGGRKKRKREEGGKKKAVKIISVQAKM
jgi:hypothetical protein